MYTIIITLLFIMPSIQVLVAAILFFLSALAYGQTKRDSLQTPLPKRPVKVGLLSSYYDQDGNRSAINGGLGSQKLESYAQEGSIYVPVKQFSGLKLNGGIDYYTSASLQQIDKYKTAASAGNSGVSGDELRRYANIGYDIGLNKGLVVTPTVGFSKEYDVLSYNAGLGLLKPVVKWGGAYSNAFTMVVDRWMVVLPGEFRAKELDANTGASSTVVSGYANPKVYTGEGIQKDGQVYPIDWRQSYAFTNNYSFVINKRSNAALGLDLMAQTGLLSAPFHRVYFNDGIGDQYKKEVRVETLPRERYKIAASGRYNVFLNSYVVLRMQARAYADSWDIRSLTLNIESPVKIFPSFAIIPFYRYHVQQGTSYYRAYGQHVYEPGKYFTSDIDLGSFDAHKFGAGLRYAPFRKMINEGDVLKKKASLFKDIGFRYARYQRQDGLWADILTLELNFEF